MRRRLSGHLRQNVVAYIALFFALGSGSAYASHLIVRSSDIVNNEVRSEDVRNDDLSGGGLTSRDVRPNALTSSDVSALTGGDVNDNSLTGSDINELTLSTTPLWAEVNAATRPITIVQSRGATSASPNDEDTNIRVTFDRDVSKCAYTVNAIVDGRFGRAARGPTANSVDVSITRAFDSVSSNTWPFQIVVNC